MRVHLDVLEIEVDIIFMKFQYEMQQLAMEIKVEVNKINERYTI